MKQELEVLYEEEETPVASSDHKMLFGSKIKPERPDPPAKPLPMLENHKKAADRAEQMQADLFGPTQIIGQRQEKKQSVSDKVSSTEYKGSVDTFGITQKLGSIAPESIKDNINNLVNEICGSDDSDLDASSDSEKEDDDFTAGIKKNLKNAKNFAAMPTQLLHPVTIPTLQAKKTNPPTKPEVNPVAKPVVVNPPKLAAKPVKAKEEKKKEVSIADMATIPLHLVGGRLDVEMNNSVSDLIGMIDSGAVEEPVRQMQKRQV